ncbi:MAG: carbohydrate kinase family protein [Bacteroidetes bacterium]|nr:carbohydrate kinase family protein [Bacteroidota bacterium]
MILTDSPFDLIAVGHIVNEMIYFPDRISGPVLGSPPSYSLVASAMQGTKTGIVTKIGEDFPSNLLEAFNLVGVDTQGISKCQKSSSSVLIYDNVGNKKIKYLSRADYIKACDVPQVYHNCKMMYVCTMEDDIQLNQIPDIVRFGNESAIDLGGYGGAHMSKKRRNQIDDLPAFALEAAGWFDFVKASDEDCRIIFGKDKSMEVIAKKLLTGKTKASLITLGSEGVLLCTQRQGCCHIPALKGIPVDVTGGGDTFMAGFLSEYLRCKDVFQSVVFGAATAICVIENTGGVKPERMPTELQVRERILQSAVENI